MANQNNYPFQTKANIRSLIDTDTDFAQECILVMQARQTADEQESKSTKHKNHRGFMSSHAVNGGKLAGKISSGEILTEEENIQAQGIVCRYTKQLASHFRAQAIEASPDLAEAAAVFSV